MQNFRLKNLHMLWCKTVKLYIFGKLLLTTFSGVSVQGPIQDYNLKLTLEVFLNSTSQTISIYKQTKHVIGSPTSAYCCPYCCLSIEIVCTV